ncbi:MAG: methyltransferase domain-containing protein [Thermoplasmata archaeon]|nr:methyltransferase domain-containing protein [Thermoplasmata archaeon]
MDNRVRRWWAPARNEVDRLAIHQGQRVADLGAGIGYLTSALLDSVGVSGFVYAVDPDQRNIEAVLSRFGSHPRLQTLRASAAHVPEIPDQSVDRVVLSLVLCCMVDKSGALDEAWRILRPGGLVLVSYPERGWRLSRRKASLRVSPTLWERIVSEHPWRGLASSRERLIRRHILQRPDSGSVADASGTTGAGPAHPNRY